ncbi:energy-coupled thiamine transporter ThiT [uncultured Veillonella sp.]|uniref:energy-coupled thiamine transporter ThiT n=1 Tax=uncultured Veillonella sp. TaxID=159268 RepID=UPI0025F01E1C|nr:energy-coupled thiamine transporter ThiT [uncultured Veillonella sp.]MDY3973153.1 energy-coupled thiamine transporter ThiT [Veillonella caviae]
MKQTQRTRMLVEAGLCIAIAYVLHFIVLFQMPQGGSVNAANLVPLVIFSMRWGGKNGVFACTMYGVIAFLLGAKFSLHYLSILLDYLVAYGVIGITGFFRDSRAGVSIGFVISAIFRWMASVISGAVVFAAYAPPGQNPVAYSVIYNATYMVPEFCINLIVILLFYERIMRGIKTSTR